MNACQTGQLIVHRIRWNKSVRRRFYGHVVGAMLLAANERTVQIRWPQNRRLLTRKFCRFPSETFKGLNTIEAKRLRQYGWINRRVNGNGKTVRKSDSCLKLEMHNLAVATGEEQ